VGGLATGWVCQQDWSGNRRVWQRQKSGKGRAADWILNSVNPECLKLTSKKEKKKKLDYNKLNKLFF